MRERVTREVLTDMAMGETRVFQCGDARACDSGKATAYQMQNILGCKFTAETDYANGTLTLTKGMR